MSANHNSMPLINKLIGIYTLTHNSIVLIDGDVETLIVLGLFLVLSRVQDSKLNTSYSCSAYSPNGVPRMVLLTADMSDSDIMKIAFEAGLVIHHKAHFLKYIKQALSQAHIQNEEHQQLVEPMGWIGDDCKAFNTGEETICNPEFDSTGYHVERNPDTPLKSKGTLQQWKTNVGVHIQASLIALVVACFSMLSIILPLLGMSSRLVNIWGTKGLGKTLLLQLAATIFGNGIDPASGAASKVAPYIAKADSTKCALDILLSSYSPFPLLLDELTEAQVDALYQMLYQVASGKGKNRARSNITAQAQKVWILSVLTTSEKSIAEILADGNKNFLGGQADRAIDVPINDLGIFTQLSGFKNVYELQGHLKKVTGLYYGTPGNTLIRYIVNNPNEAQKVFDRLDEFETRLVPVGCDAGQRRVIKHIAGALLAGYLARQAGILTCSTEVLDNAFEEVVQAWWKGQTPQCMADIGAFLEDNAGDISLDEPSLRSLSVAFIFDGLLIIRADAFERFFSPNVKDILKQFKSHQALRQEQKNRCKSRHCNNKLETYDLHLARITPYLSAEMRNALDA